MLNNVMNKIYFLLIVNFNLICSQTGNEKTASVKTYFVPIQAPIHQIYRQYAACYNFISGYTNCLTQPAHHTNIHTVRETNPLVEALLLSTTLGVYPKDFGYNHREHLPLNPYLALLLSHYGHYAPIYGRGKGLYGYTAVNNYHNNKPFGAYKVYEDTDGG